MLYYTQNVKRGTESSMKKGFYLCNGFYGYVDPAIVYGRALYLKDGLFLTDDNEVRIRRVINGEERVLSGPFEKGEESEQWCWIPPYLFPFCVDGKWGVAYAYNGQVLAEPNMAFCDCFIERYARFAIKGDFSSLSESPETFRECYDGAFGMFDEDLEVVHPPIYQHLSNPQEGIVLAKRGNKWGAFMNYTKPALPFEWDGMTFAKENIIAEKKTAHGTRYTVFRYNEQSYQVEMIMDGLTAVIIPEWELAITCHCRLVERDGRWGVLSRYPYPPTENIEPVLSREDAERQFKEMNDQW